MRINEFGFYKFYESFGRFSQGLVVQVIARDVFESGNIGVKFKGFEQFGWVVGNDLPVEKVDIVPVKPKKMLVEQYQALSFDVRKLLIYSKPDNFTWREITPVIEYGTKYVDLDRKHGYSLYGYFHDSEVLEFKSLSPDDFHFFGELVCLTKTARESGRYRIIFPSSKKDGNLVFKVDYLEIKE